MLDTALGLRKASPPPGLILVALGPELQTGAAREGMLETWSSCQGFLWAFHDYVLEQGMVSPLGL